MPNMGFGNNSGPGRGPNNWGGGNSFDMPNMGFGNKNGPGSGMGWGSNSGPRFNNGPDMGWGGSNSGPRYNNGPGMGMGRGPNPGPGFNNPDFYQAPPPPPVE